MLVTLVGAFRDAHRAWRYFSGGVLVLFLLGINGLEASMAGVLNEGVLTLAILLTVSSVLYINGYLNFWLKWLFPNQAMTASQVVLRVLLPTSLVSGFLNNTPVVALLLQPLKQWAEKFSLGGHAYLMPLSYAAIIGGTLTLVGTSTNLVVIGQLEGFGVDHELTLFSPMSIGLALVVLSLVYFVFMIRVLKYSPQVLTETIRKSGFVFSGRVQKSELIGASIAQAGLRKLQHGYLYRIGRANGDILDATSDSILQAGDEIYFIGDPALVNELQTLDVAVIEDHESQNSSLFEVVIPASSELVGKTPLELDFRKRFKATIVSLAHQRQQFTGKLGERRLEAGDLILLSADRDWQGTAHSSVFQLLSQTERLIPRSSQHQVLVLLGLLTTIGIGSLSPVGLLRALLGFVILLLALRYLSIDQLWQMLPKKLLIVVMAALGIGQAVISSGLGSAVVGNLLMIVSGPISALVLIYLATWALTELLTNNAAAAIMLPFGLLLGQEVGVPVELTGLCVMIAASCSFISPFGYQTNLMVLSAGNYHPRDFLRFGLPLGLMVALVTLSLLVLRLPT